MSCIDIDCVHAVALSSGRAMVNALVFKHQPKRIIFSANPPSGAANFCNDAISGQVIGSNTPVCG